MIFVLAAVLLQRPLAGESPPPPDEPIATTIEVSEVESPRRNVLGITSGVGLGTFFLGGKVRHDFWFLNVNYGRLIERVFLPETFLEGRWMLLGEVTIGREIRPGDAWATSLTPALRYQLESWGAIVPFVEGGYGITWTDLGPPDLGGEQQFNGQIGGGASWFIRPDFAYTAQYRFVHYSNAGLRSPNSGVNINSFLLGVAYYY